MANLRTNNLSGEGGRRAYRGAVYFDGRDSVTGIQVTAADSNDDFTLGTGDFSLEMWIFTGVSQSATLYDGRKGSASHVTPHIDLSSNVVRYLTAGTARITGSSTLSVDSWHHIAVQRQSGSTKLYVNGIQEGSTYSDSNSYVAKLNRPIIGAGDAFGSAFSGYISNVRLCKGHAVYTSNFEPPTSELTVHYNSDGDETVLLCCQDSDDPLQEATGKELLGQGGCYRGRRFSNLATNGNLEDGTTTNWNNGGCATFEVSNRSHSGSYSLHAITDSNGDAVSYSIPVTLDTEKRYKISAYILVTGSTGNTERAKMKIGSGTGGNDNYESEVVGAGNNGFNQWAYVEWIGMATANTTHVTFNESSANNVNEYFVDHLRIELWYPEEGENILANPRFTSNSTGSATGWSFTSTPSGEFTIGDGKLSVADNSRTNDAIASQTLFGYSIAEGRYRVTVDYSVSSGDFDLGIGNIRLFGVANTHDGGAGATSSYSSVIDAGSSNSSFRLVCNQHCVGEFYSITLSRVPEPKAPKIIPPYGVDAGNTFDGAITMNSPDYMYFPTGKTDERGRGRGLLMQGYSGGEFNSIVYINIQSLGNTKDFGDTTENVYSNVGGGNGLRGIFAGGYSGNNSPDTDLNIIDYVTIATTGNAKDFGNLSNNLRYPGAVSNSTRMVILGGGAPRLNVIEYLTIASTGNATDFGDLDGGTRGSNCNSMMSPTRGIVAGGNDAPGAKYNSMEYITIATTGNSQDFGDLSDPAAGQGAGGNCSSTTRGVVHLGMTSPNRVNTIEYVTIATLGDTTDFGDLSQQKASSSPCSNSLRGVWFGGALAPSGTTTNVMDYIEIATRGNSQDFGDIVQTWDQSNNTSGYGAATSDSHGGL